MKFEGSNLANKAHKLFNNNSGFPLTCMAVDAKGDLLATGAENGSISIFRFAPMTLATDDLYSLNCFMVWLSFWK